MKYELRYDGIVEQSDDLSILKKKSLLLHSEYVIYRVLKSRMEVRVEVKKEPARYEKTKKMSEYQVKMAVREIERGYPKTTLARKYGVSPDTLSRLIKEYENTQQ